MSIGTLPGASTPSSARAARLGFRLAALACFVLPWSWTAAPCQAQQPAAGSDAGRGEIRVRSMPKEEHDAAVADEHVSAAERDGATPSDAPISGPPQYTLISQGGVAKGAWQAGFAYYLTEWRKLDRRSDAPSFATVAGASAGAVNGLIAALESCKAEAVLPERSLFYRVWVESLGLFEHDDKPGLFPTDDTDPNPLGIFDPNAIESAMNEARAEMRHPEGFIAGCQVDTAFTATHLTEATHPVYVDEKGRAVLDRVSLRKRFAVRVTPHPERDTPFAANIQPALREDEPYYADLGHRKAVKRDDLLDLVQASGAFPVAFVPVDLSYVEHSIADQDTERRASFIDGGVFNNAPADLAIDLNLWRAETTGTTPTIRYILLEPNVTRWNVANPSSDRETGDVGHDILQTILGFASPFASSSSDAEFFDATQHYPFLRGPGAESESPRRCSAHDYDETLHLPVRQMPILGAELGSFFGFLEHDFRIYDFYVGMADAHHFLQRRRWHRGAQLRQLEERLRASDARYDRVAAYYARELGSELSASSEASTASSHSVTDANLEVLIEAMHEYRLWLIQWPNSSPSHAHNAFLRTLSGERASELHNLDSCESSSTQASFQYVDTDSAGFGSRTMNACELQGLIRTLAHDATEHLTDAQSGATRHALEIAHRPALDAALGVKLWPEWTLGVGIGRGIQGFVGRRIYYPLRFDLGLRALRLSAGFVPDDVDQNRLASDIFARLVMIMPATDIFSFDVFGGWHVGLGDGAGPFSGPVGGLRLTFLDRASLGYEHRYVWAKRHARSHWHEGNFFVSWQFFP